MLFLHTRAESFWSTILFEYHGSYGSSLGLMAAAARQTFRSSGFGQRKVEYYIATVWNRYFFWYIDNVIANATNG